MQPQMSCVENTHMQPPFFDIKRQKHRHAPFNLSCSLIPTTHCFLPARSTQQSEPAPPTNGLSASAATAAGSAGSVAAAAPAVGHSLLVVALARSRSSRPRSRIATRVPGTAIRVGKHDGR